MKTVMILVLCVVAMASAQDKVRVVEYAGQNLDSQKPNIDPVFVNPGQDVPNLVNPIDPGFSQPSNPNFIPNPDQGFYRPSNPNIIPNPDPGFYQPSNPNFIVNPDPGFYQPSNPNSFWAWIWKIWALNPDSGFYRPTIGTGNGYDGTNLPHVDRPYPYRPRDPRAGSYLGQRISLAIQRGNAASILETVSNYSVNHPWERSGK